MTDEEILSHLAPEMPSGNIYWTEAEQASQILPAVRRLMAEELEAVAVAAEGCRNAPAVIRAYASGFVTPG